MPVQALDRIGVMARAGQDLAVQWGHQPWSDSWARLVAEAMDGAVQALDRMDPRKALDRLGAATLPPVPASGGLPTARAPRGGA